MTYNCVLLKDQNSFNRGYKVNPPFPLMDNDTLKWFISCLRYKNVKVINNPARPGSIHKEIHYKTQTIKEKKLKRILRCDIDVRTKQGWNNYQG